MADMLRKQAPPSAGTPAHAVVAGGIVAAWPAEDLLAANLEALSRRDTVLAEAIAAVQIPGSVNMAEARDGSVSFRWTSPEGKRCWLGYSSLPRVSALANLKRIKIGDGNLIMDGMGHGAEAELILQDMGSHQAVIVTESDPLWLNLALRLHDFTRSLCEGRLVLLLTQNPPEDLPAFYRRHPGYNLATEIVAWPWRTDSQKQAFGRMIGQVMDRINDQQNTAMAQVLQDLAMADQRRTPETLATSFAPEAFNTLRALNICRMNSIGQFCRSREVLAGLAGLGAQVDFQMPNRPDGISPRSQLERLRREAPSLILLVDALRADTGICIPKHTVCATVTTPNPWAQNQSGPERLGPCDFLFPAWHGQYEALLRAGFPAERTIHLPLAAHTGLFQPQPVTPEMRQEFPVEVAVIADRHSLDPEHYEFHLPTHQSLWRAVIQEIQRRPEDYEEDRAEDYFQRAQRCGVELKEQDLREFFVGLVRQYIGDTVLLETYGHYLEKEKINWGLWYNAPLRTVSERTRLHYWDQSPLFHRLRGAVDHGEERNRLFNAVPIHIYIRGNGWVDHVLLDGIAAGAFFLVKAHRRGRKPDGWSEYFAPGREIITFDTPNDLVRKVRYYLQHDAERKRIAEAARQKLLAHHSCQVRARQMLEAIHQRLR